MAKTLLPPGFRFHPTDVELVQYYLKRKVMGKTLHFEAIADLDIYKFAPWDLPDKSCLRSRDLKWYFFCPRERKYANGARMNRATEFGYWKTTGKDRPVLYNKQTVGMIKTLVFHRGRAPRGVRTDWVMHEYRLDDRDLADVGVVQDAYVLSMIFQKSGPGPRNGAQYGAPFHEEDWNDDVVEVNCSGSSPFAYLSAPALALPNNQNSSIVTSTMVPGASFNEEDWNDDVDVNCAESSPFACLSTPALVLPNNQSSSIVTSTMVPGSTCSGSSLQLGPSKTVPSADGVLPPVPGSTCSWFSLELGPSKTVPSADWVLPPVPYDDDIDSTLEFPDDDILSMFTMFTEDGTLLSIENDENKKLNNLNRVGNVEAASCLDGNNIYNDLGDLGNLADHSGDGFNLSNDHNVVYTMDRMLPSDDISFLELTDLGSPLKCLAEASGSKHFPIDGLLEPYDCYNNSEHFCHPDNPFGAVLNVSGLSQSRPLPAKGFYQFEDHLDVFQKKNGGGENENQGCKAASYSVDVTCCERSELGSKLVPQAQKRGEQQRKSYSRFQHLLESIPARPASAAEHPAPTYGAKRSDRSTLFSPYGGSSIHKAEVTLRGGGRTKDALSNKSVEFQCICYGCNLHKGEFGKEVSTCSSGYTFVFFLGMFSALMWIFIVAVVTKLGRYVWKLVIS